MVKSIDKGSYCCYIGLCYVNFLRGIVMLKLSLLITLLVGAWSWPVLGCVGPSKTQLVGDDLCHTSSIASGGGKWYNSQGDMGQFVSVLWTKSCSFLSNKRKDLRLTIYLDNGKSEEFAWSVPQTPPLLWISENEGSKHTFESDDAKVIISYDNDKEQSIITVQRDGEKLVLRDENLAFEGLPLSLMEKAQAIKMSPEPELKELKEILKNKDRYKKIPPIIEPPIEFEKVEVE